MYLKRNGLIKTVRMSVQRIREQRAERDYPARRSREKVTLMQLKAQEEHVFSDAPFMSVIVPAYETQEDYLRVLLDSLLVQSYPHFELIVADGSRNGSVSSVCAEYDDDRLVYIKLKSNGGISSNTNEALKSAKGDVAVFADHDDFLEPDALFHLALAFEDGARLVYTDEDKFESQQGREGRYFCPNYKPDFDYDLLLSNNYISHLTGVGMDLVKSVGGFRSRFDGAQDYDLILRCVHAILKDTGFFEGGKTDVNHLIRHVPRVLYHWRVHDGSTADNPRAKNYAYEAGRKALQEHLSGRGIECRVSHTEHLGFYSVAYEAAGVDELHYSIPGNLVPLCGQYRELTEGIFARPEVRAVVYRVIDRRGTVADRVCDGVKWWDSGVMHRNAMPRDLKEPRGRAYCIRKNAGGSLIVYVPAIMFKIRKKNV